MVHIHSDHLNTPKVVTDKNQAAAWKADYKPFGEVDEVISTVDMKLRFPGQYEDEETALNYNYFRSYNSTTGRYTQSDPIGLRGGLNTFSYVSSRVIVWGDPSGLFASSVFSDKPSTIQCDGNGDYEVVNNTTNACARECTQKHEESHILDWKARYGETSCAGKKRGYVPTYGPQYDAFRKRSECEAYRISQSCALKKTKECGCKNDQGLKDYLKVVTRRLNEFCYGAKI